jgi:hypothetical protein
MCDQMWDPNIRPSRKSLKFGYKIQRSGAQERHMTNDLDEGPRCDNRVVVMLAAIKADLLRFDIAAAK